MADSDDEYDRKRRDKFQGERTESYRSSDRRKDEDQWSGRQRVRTDYRDRYSQQYQSDMPPTKRMRYDMEDRRMRYMDTPYSSYSPWGPEQSSYVPNNSSNDVETQPPIMTFKAFLQTQDDNITDEEAIAKYAEYKLEFRRQQLNEFFVAHKEEEWFKLKYHPEESQKRKEEHLNSLKKRAQVFLEMLENGRIDTVKVDADSGDEVVKLLDAVVIRLEGGTDLDLTILDQPPPGEQTSKEIESKDEKKDEEKGGDKDSDKEDDKPKSKKKDRESSEARDDEKKVSDDEKDKGEMKMEEDEEEEKKEEEREDKDDDDDGPPGVDPESESEKEDKSPPKSPPKQDDLPDSSTEALKKKNAMKNEEVPEVEEGEKPDVSDNEASEKDTSDEVVPLTPRPLHRTSSIFLRTISPRITKAEIEAICKRYPGFLRISLADPQPDQHWFRRGWVTFRRDVNVKEICWNLNNIRVKDCELGAIVNRDLSRRVRTVSGLSAVKQVVLHDIKLCAKLIQDLDARGNLWSTPTKKSEQSFGLVSANPVLKGITDFLVDEASAEEEELLGQEAIAEETKEKHNQALKVLDRLLLYLRIVHSVDFYNQSHYPNEDEMPNRCGIMHLRGTPSSTEVSPQEIAEYTETFRSKLTSLLAAPTVVDDCEMTSLGSKSQDSEVEKFILANTQELSKDKWLCPLSGKKFKGPEFVRKHIYNKYSNELEEVKKEVDYFNNYLRDPKRPQLAEHPGNRGKKDSMGESQGYNQPFAFGGGYRGRGNFGLYGGPGYGSRGSRGFLRGRGMDYRPVITYRDLDAPCEPEEII